jgi:two-component system, OmpR family, sensor histidine kinase VicK
MTLNGPSKAGMTTLVVSASYPRSAGAAENFQPLAALPTGISGLAGSTLGLAILALALCTFGGWTAAHKILKRRYSRTIKNLEHRFNHEIRLLDSAIDQHSIVSVTDRDGNFLKVNKNFEDAFGFSSAEIIGKCTSVLYGAAVVEQDASTDLGETCPTASFCDVHTSIQNGLVWSGGQTLRRANGETVHMMSTILPHFDDQGNHVHTVSLRTDITQKRMDESQRQLTRMLEELQDEVFLYDVDELKISYMNKSALARCEWTAEEALGRPIADTAANFSVPHFRAHVAPLMDGSRDVVSIETTHEKGPVEISTRIYVGPNGNEVFLSVLRDTSERKKLKAVKMNTLATVSHELRTPLTSIKGALRLVQSGVAGELSSEIKSMIDIASRNSDRLLDMVNDILVLEKMNANKVDFTLEETDLAAVVMDAVSINKGFGDELGVSFVYDPLPPRSLVAGNSDRLMQVMTNLMSNAAKYSPPGGTVHVGVRNQGKTLRVYVTDNGPGVPEDARATIFDSFTQFSAADGTTRSGTGLGLQICKKIVARHHGSISYESDPGKETTFYFDLPNLAGTPELTVIESGSPAGRRKTHLLHEQTDMASNG